MIRIKDLVVDLKEFALKNIDLEVKEGEYFVIIGPTGAGKSILLETMVGFHFPVHGSIELDGKNITREEPRKREIGIVFQDYMLFPHLSVKKNIEFGLKKKKSSCLDDITKLTKFLEIDHILERMPDTLSGGESQRVALARALINNPKVLLLDEPLSALDLNTRDRIIKMLGRIKDERKTTIIHVTHDQFEAVSLADRIAVMNKGRILQIGAPDQVFRRPNSEFVANFVGVENLFNGTAEIDPLTELSVIKIKTNREPEGYLTVLSTMKRTGNVRLSIRPEDILISVTRIETSARNIYKGRIASITDQGIITKVVVDVGIPFATIITKRSFEDLALKEDMSVYITFKATAVHIF